MKTIKCLLVSVVLVLVASAGVLSIRADDTKAAKPKPYPLDTCLVCGMKLGDMGKPYVFVYKGQEIKVCDKSEKADFDKAPAKYLKELAKAKAKLKKLEPQSPHP
jgi:YHS domain-containing protein